MEIRTHQLIDHALCGRPLDVARGKATVELATLPAMVVDERGLVHGGFVFGLADHAAMLAVGDPNVVLGAAEVRFLKPVVVGERLRATARMREELGKKRLVEVVVERGDEAVMTGTLTCFVLPHHVLAEAGP